MKTVIEKLTKANFYVKIREDTKPMRQPSDDGRVNIIGDCKMQNEKLA